jgi:hypothetical protein
MKPGWLVRIGLVANVIAQLTLRPLIHRSRVWGALSFVSLTIVASLLVYALFAPAEKADLVGDAD